MMVNSLLLVPLALSLAFTGPKTRLRLEVIRTEPVPVIDSLHPDAKDIPGGFEAGTTVKVTIQGKTAYHMVTSAMPTADETRWAYLRTEHWISDDGLHWKRHRVLFKAGFDPDTGLWEMTASPFFFFDEAEDRWYIYFNYLAFSEIKPWNTPTLLRRSAAVNKGIEGINGDFEFPGTIVAPSGIAHPTDAEASSISPPFRAADGNWYAFLGGGPEPFNTISGRWWVLIVRATSPAGPFIYMPAHAPEFFMEPTGYVENPMITKIRGPLTGKEYWTVIFDFLKSEVTIGYNHEIGFSCSEDGLTWPVGNAQMIDIRPGLPSGSREWWRAIRVPHQLCDEGNGIYSCFFSAYDRQGAFEGIGRVLFRVTEVIE